MSRRIARSHRAAWALGLLALFAANHAGGQVAAKPPTDTGKKPAASATHIKIQKEQTPKKTGVAGGEVMMPPAACDSMKLITIDANRDDSIRAAQHAIDEGFAAAERLRLVEEMRAQVAERVAIARESMRAESIAAADARAAALKLQLARGYYVGVGVGASTPQRDLRNGYAGGWNATVPFGFDASDNPFGIRTDLSVDHLNGTRIHDAVGQTVSASGDITAWSLNVDLKMRFSAPGGSTRSHLYLLGGAGANRVTGGVYGTTDPKAGQNLTFADAKTNFGWNAGAGAAVAWGPAEVFIESRFFQLTSNLAYNQSGGVGTYSSFTPMIIGVQWF